MLSSGGCGQEGAACRVGGGYDEKGVIYCVLMSSFDVPPLFAVCTPGSLLLASDWPSAAAAGGGGGGGRGEGGLAYSR